MPGKLQKPQPDQPITELCTDAQVAQLLAFVATADGIALRDQLADATLSEMADDLPGMSVEDLEALCAENSIDLPLGAETRLEVEDHDALLMYAEREAAWRGTRG